MHHYLQLAQVFDKVVIIDVNNQGAKGTGHLWRGMSLISLALIFDSWHAGHRERGEGAKGVRYLFLIAKCGESLEDLPYLQNSSVELG